MPGPVSVTEMANWPLLAPAAMFTFPASVNLMAHEVEQHLREALLVTEANGKRLVHGCRERELLVLREGLGGRAHRLDHALDRVFAHVEGELAGFDLGDVEHGIDEAQQMLAVGWNAGEGIHRLLR